MESKKILVSLAFVVLFSCAALFLFRSLSTEKLLTFQNDAFVHFIGEVKDGNLADATVSTFSFLWSAAVFKLLVFINILSIGFLLFLIFSEKADANAFLAAGILAAIGLFFITGLSHMVLFIAVGVIVSIIWLQRTFETGERPFLTGFSFIKSGLRAVTMFLIAGFLIVVFTNIGEYQALLDSANVDLLDVVAPASIKDLRKQEIDNIVDGLEDGLDSYYGGLESDTRSYCGPMYTGLVATLENYRESSHEQIDQMDISGYAATTLPGFDVFNKLSPLFAALGLLVILSLLNSLSSLIYGMIYSVVARFYTVEQSKTSSSVKA